MTPAWIVRTAWYLLLAATCTLAAAQGSGGDASAAEAEVAVTLSPSAPQAGDPLYAFFEGLPAGALLRAELVRAEGGAASWEAGEALRAQRFDAGAGYVSLDLPYAEGSYVLRVVRDADPEEVIMVTDSFQVRVPDVVLDVPAAALPGELVPVSWGQPAPEGDVLRIEPLAPGPGGAPMSPLEVGGSTSVDVEAPAEPGSYRLRLEAADGTVRAEATLIVEGVASAEAEAEGCFEGDGGASLRRAFEQELDAFLQDARQQYGSDYENLAYDVTVRNAEVHGSRGTVEADYDGSATYLPTGETVDASGTIVASFVLSGCSWTLEGADY